MTHSLKEKLEVLADAAKYDASCSSSGGKQRNSRDGKGLGSITGAGICHAFTPDGRCISLLKILLTNFCVYDCAYCINRSSSNVRRARFSVDEVTRLTIGFYRRNMIEGLFLSSGIIRSSDYTMGELVRVAQSLRTDHAFRGYIHLKTIPGASADLIAQAGLYADRLSVNIELPSDESVQRLAPEKSPASIRETMADVRQRLEERRDSAKHLRSTPRFAPAGQSTQMIIGADTSDDRKIIARSAQLYGSYHLKRVYYSAFSPIPDSSAALPLLRPPLMREHRLYQADWLMRYYDFRSDEILAGSEDGMLDLTIDPKLAWALRHRAQFPVDINRAPRDMLLRVPGLGVRVVDRILTTRRHRRLRESDLRTLVKSPAKVLPFVVAADWQPGGLLDSEHLAQTLAPPAHQLSLF